MIILKICRKKTTIFWMYFVFLFHNKCDKYVNKLWEGDMFLSVSWWRPINTMYCFCLNIKANDKLTTGVLYLHLDLMFVDIHLLLSLITDLLYVHQCFHFSTKILQNINVFLNDHIMAKIRQIVINLVSNERELFVLCA